MLLRWTPEAAADLESIYSYILQDSPDSARAVATLVFRAVESLQSFPDRGRLGRVPATRELVVSGLPLRHRLFRRRRGCDHLACASRGAAVALTSGPLK